MLARRGTPCGAVISMGSRLKKRWNHLCGRYIIYRNFFFDDKILTETCSRHCSLHSLSLDTTTRPLLPLHSLYFITFWQNWRNLNSFVKCCPCLDNWQRPSQRLCFRNEILWKCWSHWKMADLLKCVRQLWNLEHFQNTEPWKMRLTCCHVSANFEIQISNTQIIRLKSPYVTMTVQIEMSTW